MTSIAHLEPRAVWSHFATLCAIPRPSKHEGALREHLRAWARERGLDSTVDAIGNLVLRKPATPGAETCPGVVLQGHLDMVCQKNDGVAHDFFRDPIRPVLADGWLAAPHTTLGADNGIGVALALAALEADDLPHPPLEVLLTIDEEAGMGGVRGVAPHSLRGRYLINLDTEEWGKLYVGCAGGLDVRVHQHWPREALPAGRQTWRLVVNGLQGGHSGIDIHRGRGNAIKLLVEALNEAAAILDLRLLSLQGGTARNALPREAFANISLPAADGQRLTELAAAWQAAWRQRLGDADPGVQVQASAQPVQNAAPASALTHADQQRLLAFLAAAPHGVRTFSQEFSGVVETSDNLGVVSLQDGSYEAVFMVRSLLASRYEALADEIVDCARQHGAEADKVGTYPAWTPNRISPLLARFQDIYAREFGQAAEIEVIHAGLECGLLSASQPHLDMISFGPDICGAHAPGERVEVTSVSRCWHLLRAVLRELATPGNPE